jgi:iron complex outermembrane receptor protein
MKRIESNTAGKLANVTTWLYAIVAGVISWSAAAPAPAQTTPAQTTKTATVATPTPAITELDTIVVTARRTEEKLQDVPVAVTALSGDALAELGVTSQTDLQFATPGLTVRQTGSSDQLNYAIRGQSVDAFSFASPAVVAYFNEVQVGGVANTSFFDLESIQVLKGPQGTLFGRNATGGAVLYGSKKPTHELNGYFKAGLGNYGNGEFDGAVNIPMGDAVALRVSGRVQKRDGFQHNLLYNIYENSIDSKVGRVSLLIAPSESGFENVTVFQKGKYGGRTGSVKMQNANGVNGTPATYLDPVTGTTKPLTTNFRDVYFAGNPSADPRVNALFNGVADFLTKQQRAGFYDVYSDASGLRDGDQTLVTNTTSYNIGDNMQIKNIFGYNKVISNEQTDIDGSPYTFLAVGGGTAAQDKGYTFGTKQWSDELQLNGTAGAVKYIVGVFVSKEDTDTRIPLSVGGDLPAATRAAFGLPGFIGPYAFVVTDKSKAVYGQLTYALNERLNLSAGMRYTQDEVEIVQHQDSLVAILNGGNHSRKDSKPSWLIGVDYKVSPDLMIYFNQRGSWRTGGFNGTSAASFPNAASFKPETTYDFEVGAKYAGDLGSVPARVNIAVYNQVIKDVQRAPYLNISALAGNVNKARVTGTEIDATFQLRHWLEVGGAFAYTDAKYTDPRAVVASTNFIFGPYADSPKTTASAFFRTATELGANRGELAFRGEVYNQSSFFYSNLAASLVPNAKINGYSVINVRAELNGIAGSKVDAAIYAKNVTDKEYEVGGFPLGAVTGSNGTLPGTPRMIGVEIGVKF